MLKPELMLPYYRHGAMTPWGGTKLRTVFHRDIPDETTGESLEVSVIPGMNSRLSDGTPLSEYLALHGESALGRKVKGDFPLLLKIIDARDTLSVQVHPDDEYAARAEGKTGKTEAWVILQAEEGAELVYGLKGIGSREDIVEASESGEIRNRLNRVRVAPGEVYYIPAGTVHAIGKGILLYEIQQSSDITYRLYDWDRRDAQGRSRPLHIRQAADVADITFTGRAVSPVPISLSRERILREKYFTLERFRCADKLPLMPDTGYFAILTAVSGADLKWEGGEMHLEPGRTVFLPADGYPLTLTGEDCLLACPTVEEA